MAEVKQDIYEMVLAVYETAKDNLRDFLQLLKETWHVLLILFALLMLAWWHLDPPPPSHIVMATGTPGGTYHQLGQRYAKFFESRGIKLEQVETIGAAENLRLLTTKGEHKVQAGFVQAGLVDPDSMKGLVSLGAVVYTPIWFFYRGEYRKEIDFEVVDGQLKHFPNYRISIGTIGSGTYAQASKLLRVSGADLDGPQFIRMQVKDSVQALKRGEIDAVFIADSHIAKNVQELLDVYDPNIHISSIKRAPGYARLLKHLQILNLPEGGVDMAHRIPRENTVLLATTTHVVVDEKLNSAIQYLFIAAEKEINGRPGFFATRNEFPKMTDAGIPESPVFERYEKSGQPWLMTYLPFWLAELVDRLVIVVFPFLIIAYPFLTSLPKFKAKRIYTRINRIYGVLKGYEIELAHGYDPALVDTYLKKLDHLEYLALKLNVPKNMSNDYYALRTNINYVRDCLNRGEKPYRIREEMPTS